MHLVLAGPENARARVIGDDEIDALAGKLLARVSEKILGLGREADDETGPPASTRGDGGENVRVLDERQRRRRAASFSS